MSDSGFMKASLQTLVVLSAVLIAPASVPALADGCVSPFEAVGVGQSIRRATDCRIGVLDGGSSAADSAGCSATPAPSCSGTLVTDALRLAWGPGNDLAPPAAPDRLREQILCQKQIALGVRSFVEKRLVSLLTDEPADSADAVARAELDKVPAACAVTVARDPGGLVLPSVGPQCAAAVGSPGDTVNGVALAGCLHTLLDVWVRRYGPAGAPLRPNIVFIITDDQRWDTIGPVHSVNGTDVMPGVRANLIDQGIQFDNSFLTTPWCCPSRSSVLSGLYAHNHGVLTNSPPLGGAAAFDDSVTLATLLQGAGYRTGLFGKYLNLYDTLWVPPQPPYQPPGWDEWHAIEADKYFDYFLVENGVEVYYGSAPKDYLTDVLRNKAVTFIHDSVALGVPFFLYFAPLAPHEPYVPAPRHVGLFTGLAPWRPPSYNEADTTDKPLWVQQTSPLAPQQEAMYDQVRIDALETLQAVDEAVVTIMAALTLDNVDQNTIVVYYSDHGFLWGEHRLIGKNEAYEESIRGPMVVRYPALAPLPRSESRIAGNIDFLPTFADLAGVVPPATDGASLVPLLDDTAQSWRTEILEEGWQPGHPWISLRSAQWKYTEYTTGDIELYDLVNDPDELTSAHADPANAGVIAAMSAQLHTLRPNWPADAGCVDQDGDGWNSVGAPPTCATPGLDCDDTDSGIWNTPGAARNLLLAADTATLTWNPPLATGGATTSLVYDVLRAPAPDDFRTAFCIESDDGPNTVARDVTTPPAGRAFYYLVRAQNACPQGSGSLGFSSKGLPRVGRGCP